MNSNSCPVCLTPRAESTSAGDGSGLKVSCRRCGKFKLGWIAEEMFLAQISSQQRANLSGWICKNQNCVITSRNVQELLATPTPPVREKAERLLQHLAETYPTPGETIELSENTSLELQAVASAIDHEELLYLMREYLHEVRGFLLISAHTPKGETSECFKISPEGWANLDSLRQENPRREIGFHVVH